MAGILEIWSKNKQFFEDKNVQQILGLCGDGQMIDGGKTSKEFRELLAVFPSSLLKRYSEECLTSSFTNSGLVLQDLVNHVGARLGFDVSFGLYKGKPNQIGYDGIWASKEGFKILVEVKTTDTYRINLNTLAEYRRKLIAEEKISLEKSSILIVVGRQDTGDLEAQIRGSRSAWDIRLISVEALFRLMKLKEEVEDPKVVWKISEILIPHEYTKVDGIIDIAFSAAEEVRHEETADTETIDQDKKPKFVPVKFNLACVERISSCLKRTLVQRSSAKFATPDGKCVLTCAVSREHDSKTSPRYWFAFHDHQKSFLSETQEAYAGFGCGSEKTVFLIPFNIFKTWLDGMNTTSGQDRLYWHVHIYVEGNKFFLSRKKDFQDIDITKYLLPS